MGILRYSSSTNNGMDLVLTDCPNNDNEMAYLSQLLTWHAMDPVNERETQRNQRVCERWQGNRNPFIDLYRESKSLNLSLGLRI